MTAWPKRRLAKWAASAGGIILAVVIVASGNSPYLIVFGTTPTYPHHLQIVAPSAFEAIKGERVTEGGIGVGEITQANVTDAGKAHLVLGLNDNAWPVPTDSTIALRMGGTIKFTDRFIQIVPGRGRAVYADNAVVPGRHFIVPVEYDTVFNIFNKETRHGLGEMMNNGGPAMATAAAPLNHALSDSAPALGQIDAVFRDLSYDQQALSSLVSSTSELTSAVASSNPGLQTLINSAANTFVTLGGHSRQLAMLVDDAAPALTIAGATAYHLHRTLTHLTVLSNRLEPGIHQLTVIAPAVDATLRRILAVEPAAVTALTTVSRHGAAVENLLTAARTKLMPQTAVVGKQAAVELNCIRPYTPDFISWDQGWAGYFSAGLKTPHIHVVKARITFLPFPNAMPINSEQMHQLFPQLSTGFPQVPGEGWNQPWYQPQCGLTAADLNPADNPQTGTFDPNGSKSISYGPTTSPTFAPEDPSLFGVPKTGATR